MMIGEARLPDNQARLADAGMASEQRPQEDHNGAGPVDGNHSEKEAQTHDYD